MSERGVSDSMLRPSTMSPEAFRRAFGGVYEHSPWVTETVLAGGLDARSDTPEGLATQMAEAVASAPEADQLALLRSHPDLAGKLALAGEMTAASISEQASAGLDRCSPEELARFHTLNSAYTEKFGFPFIVAVRGMHRTEILEMFEQRIANPPEVERAEALRQVNRIAYLRLVERFAGR